MSIKDKIAQANDLPLHEIEVPEWDCTVYLRTATVAEVEQIAQRSKRQEESLRREGLMHAWTLAQFLCEADGTRVFNGDEFRQLGGRSFTAIKRLHDLAAQLNGMLPDDEADEEVKKKSEADSNGSGTDYL